MFDLETAETAPQADLPAWWDVPKGMYVPPEQRETKQKQAQRVLKALMDKRLQGQDLDDFDLQLLRQTSGKGISRLRHSPMPVCSRPCSKGHPNETFNLNAKGH
ncbi:hypothetical protein CYMTET_30025 [Cymbomonas tetramitiformis]|uniref:Uncharacterized protein n=1 Tax=Cymbomonas tetramitiformis TaxID=36881 RepID=A0AAE0FJT1_9CHLO|nr:hypothetical protein CYMTET_30025 [Cymbomonas tetramitiformis]